MKIAFGFGLFAADAMHHLSERATDIQLVGTSEIKQQD